MDARSSVQKVHYRTNVSCHDQCFQSEVTVPVLLSTKRFRFGWDACHSFHFRGSFILPTPDSRGRIRPVDLPPVANILNKHKNRNIIRRESHSVVEKVIISSSFHSDQSDSHIPDDFDVGCLPRRPT